MCSYTDEMVQRSLADQEVFWIDELAGAPMYLESFFDHPRSPGQAFVKRSEALTLAAWMVRRLEQFGAREGVTFFVVILSAICAVLGRYTGHSDIVISTPSHLNRQLQDPSGRPTSNHIVPLRMRLAERERVSDLVQ